MKKRDVDHVLRTAGRIPGEKQFIIIGSQALHGKHPDLPDAIWASAEVDLIAARLPDRTEWLNAIGADSPFHETFGFYADPVDAAAREKDLLFTRELVRRGLLDKPRLLELVQLTKGAAEMKARMRAAIERDFTSA